MTRSLLLPTLGMLLAATGCRTEICEATFEKMSACGPIGSFGAPPKEKGAFVERCQAERREHAFLREDDPDLRACLAQDTCDEYQACMTVLAKQQFARRQLARVEAAERSGDAQTIREACEYVDDDHPAVAEACTKLLPTVLADFAAKVERLRDQGEHDFETCLAWAEFARRSSPEAVAAAERACRASQAAQEAATALAAAERQREAAAPEIPYACETALTTLGALDSDWARARTRDVVQACYAELGVRVLEHRLSQREGCEPPVRAMVEVLDRHAGTVPAAASVLAQARARCDP